MKQEQLEMAARVGIQFPTILPLFSSPPNEVALKRWVDKHADEGLSSLAQKIADHIDYIPFETFMEQLRHTIETFNRSAEPYILWLTSQELFTGCSDAWVAGLALEHCGLAWPTAIATTSQLAACLETHSEVRTLLILDDAAYSGRHISDQIMNFVLYNLNPEICAKDIAPTKAKGYQLFFGIPFMTSQAQRHLSSLAGNFFDLHFLEPTPLQVGKEILNKEELKQMEKLGLDISTTTLSYFDHKLPDAMSSFFILESGNHLHIRKIIPYMQRKGFTTPDDIAELKTPLKCITDPDEWNRLVAEFFPGDEVFIPLIIPPYKLKNEEGLAQLSHALKNNKLGHRNSYTVLPCYKTLLELAGPAAPAKATLSSAGFFSNRSMLRTREAEAKSSASTKKIESSTWLSNLCSLAKAGFYTGMAPFS